MEEKKSWSLVTMPAAATAIGIGVVGYTKAFIVPLKIPLWCMGFAGSGVKAGSIAAAIQGLIGNVSAGSVFALCQSYGAVGLTFSSLAPWAIVAVPVVLVLYRGLLGSKVVNCCSATEENVPTTTFTGLGEKVGGNFSGITNSIGNLKVTPIFDWCRDHAKTAVDYSVSTTEKIVPSTMGLGEKAETTMSGVTDSVGNLRAKFAWNRNYDTNSSDATPSRFSWIGSIWK